MTEVFKPNSKYVIGQLASWIISFIIFWPLVLAVPFILIYYYFWLKNTEYEAREDGVFKKTGIITKSQSLFLYKQIQDVQEQQGILDRIFGLKTLKIKTMSGSSSLGGDLIGISIADADRLRSLIIRNIDKQISEVNESRTGATTKIKEEQVITTPYKLYPNEAALAAIVPVIIGAILVGLLSMIVSPIYLFVLISLGLLLAGITGIGAYFTSRFLSYEITNDWMSIKYDFLVRNVTNYRYDRIQNVIIYMPWGYKLLGIAGVRIETGESLQLGSGGKQQIAYNFVPAMKVDDAYKLKDLLLQRIGVQSKETVRDLRTTYPLENVKPIKKTIGSMIVLTVLTMVAFILAKTFAIIIIGALLILLIFVYEWFYFKNYSYKTNDKVLIVKKGVLGRSEIFIPYNRVQTIFLDMDVLDRVFGLYDLHLSTIGIRAGSHIDGLNSANSEGLKKELLAAVEKNRTK
ncbi:MAG: PH domain-containing protein [Candidatus Micrarchaeota archaeon]|nr:PH domain-containing protein [Candidatus Micrarchaeota archaeon]